jgi:uncharacterized protein YecT (DUF1311 family)
MMPKLRPTLPSLAFLAIMATTGAAAAQDCNDAQTQAAMTECAGDAYDEADRKLNETYKQIADRLADAPEIKASLKKAQRAWITFRDAECEFTNAQAVGGSLYGALITQCLAELTEQRAEMLQTYLQCEEGDMSCPVPEN